MKFSRSNIFVIVAVLAIVFWFWINSGLDDGPTESSNKRADIEASEQLPEVVVVEKFAQLHDRKLKLYGRTEAVREVTLKAETAGLVVSTPVSEGKSIKRGTIVCKQDVDARQANLDQANALLLTREMEYKAAKSLVEKGYRSETQLATAQAALDGARAGVKQAEIELDNVNVRAPFYGIFEQQLAEIGDYLSPGQACGRLVELDPLIVAVELTEQQVGGVELGQIADIALITGETLQGKIRLVEPRANPSTRTFRTEIEVPNKGFKLKGGVTADVTLAAGQTNAQNIPSSILTLNDDGILGVKYLDSNNIVRFAQTQTIDESTEGIWVTGLPDSATIIVQGQEYVATGTEVVPTQSQSQSPDIIDADIMDNATQ